jgi:methylase of polypeptide subunit release factors
VAIDNDFTDARYNLAKAFKASANFTEATNVYASLLNKVPGHIPAMFNLANLYSEQDKPERAISLYKRILTLEPEHLKARINLALIKSRMGRRTEAINELEKVLEIDPEQRMARRHLRKLCSSLIPGWHIDMINDDARNSAYDKAIRAAVKSANHVLEIGTGSGLLAMMAARAGARQVTTCEMEKPLADCARKIIRHNGYEDHIRVIGKKSTSLKVGAGMDLDGRADVLIAEVFDVGLLGEHFLPALFHARQNLLTDDALIIPAAATIKGVLAECKQLRRVNPIQSIAGFDLSEFNLFRSPGYRQIDMVHNDYRALSDPFDVLALDFKRLSSLSQQFKIDVCSTRKGRCQAVIFWFELVLDSETIFSSRQKAGSNHWKQAIQFFDTDYPTEEKDIFQLDVKQDRTGIRFCVLSKNNQ